jgi:hypothetical protein
VVLTAGLTAVVLALVESDQWGRTSVATLGVLAAGVVLLAGFCLIENRVANPLVDFALFRNRPYLGATAGAFALVGAYWTITFYAPQFLQVGMGYSAVAAGALILPLTAPMAFLSPFTGSLLKRFGARGTMTVGLLLGVAGVLLQTRIGADSDYLSLLPGYLLFGISLAIVYAPMSTAALAAMPRAKVGIASGVLVMNRVLAGALLLAVSGALFQGELPEGAGSATSGTFADALSVALLAPAAVMAAGAVATWLLLPSRPAQSEVAPADAAHYQHHRRFHL